MSWTFEEGSLRTSRGRSESEVSPGGTGGRVFLKERCGEREGDVWGEKKGSNGLKYNK